MMDYKKHIVDILRHRGPLTASRLGYLCRRNYYLTRKLLYELELERRIRQAKRHVAVFWEIDYGMDRQLRFTESGKLELG